MRVAAIAMLALVQACAAGSSGRRGGSGGACVEGQSIGCVCTSGESGAQICQADATLGPCVCGDQPPTDAVDPDAADATDPDPPDTDAAAPDPDGGEDPPDEGEDPPDEGEDPPDEGEDPPDEGEDPPDPPEGCTDPIFGFPASHWTFASLPDDPTDYLCDADGNGTIDANDGEYNDFAKLMTTADIDLNAQLGASMIGGLNIVLLEHQGYSTFATYDVNVLRGSPVDQQPPCDEGAGDCPWLVDPASLDVETCERGSTVPDAKVTASVLQAGPGIAYVPFPMSSLSWIDVQMVDVRIAGVTSGDIDIAAGRLCGAFNRTGLLDAIDELCLLDNTIPICPLIFTLPSLLTCGDDEVCTAVLRFEAQGVASLDLGP